MPDSPGRSCPTQIRDAVRASSSAQASSSSSCRRPLPYFAAIAAILGSGTALGGRLAALVLYNACFVLPLIAIFATLITTGDRAQRILETGRHQLQTRWPAALTGLLLAGGGVVIALASVGLVARA